MTDDGRATVGGDCQEAYAGCSPSVPEGDITTGSERLDGERVAYEAILRGPYMQALAALRTDRADEAITLLDSLLARER